MDSGGKELVEKEFYRQDQALEALKESLGLLMLLRFRVVGRWETASDN